MIFYVLLYPLAFSLTFAIVTSDIAIIQKEMLATVPLLAVTAGLVDEFRERKNIKKKTEDSDEN